MKKLYISAFMLLVNIASVCTVYADTANSAGSAPSAPSDPSLEVKTLRIDRVDSVSTTAMKKTVSGFIGKTRIAVVFQSAACKVNGAEGYSSDATSTSKTLGNCGECAKVIEQAILKKASLELIGQFSSRKIGNRVEVVFKEEPYCTSEPKPLMPSI